LVKAWAKTAEFQKIFTSLPTNAELVIKIIEQINKEKRREEYSIYDILLA
jgi:hypothetical protein